MPPQFVGQFGTDALAGALASVEGSGAGGEVPSVLAEVKRALSRVAKK